MLPNKLSSIYQQYKQDTDAVAAWLASTAKARGYPADLLASHSWDVLAKHQQTGRLKGKQRKEAAASSKSNTTPKDNKYIVAIKDFVPLANFITSRTNPPVVVPTVFAKTIDRLITLRAGYGKMRTDAGADRDSVEDEKHNYFVGILQTVRDALKLRMAPDAAATAAAKPKPPSKPKSFQTAAQGLSNKFSALTVSDPSQAFIDEFASAPVERPMAQQQDPVDYVAEEQTNTYEALFAFTLLMNDLNQIRSHVQWIWSNHRAGRFDLGAAAVATEVASSLARGMIEDIEPLLNRFEKGAWGVFNRFLVLAGLGKGYTAKQLSLISQEDDPSHLYDLANDTCMVSFTILRACAKLLDPQHLPLYQEGMLGHYDAKRDRAKMSDKDKFLEDKIIITELFTEFIVAIRCVPDYPVADELMRGMKGLEKTGTVPFSLVFAMQIILDINHTMRDEAHGSLRNMLQQVSGIDTNLQSYLDYHKNLRIDHWPESKDMALKEVSRRIKWMVTDPVYQVKSKVLKEMGLQISPRMERHRLLIYSPVLSGLYLYCTRFQMWVTGIAIADAWGSITYTAQLYNALQKQQLLSRPWQDMDITMSLLGDSSFWVGNERPSEVGDCFQKFCLQMGVTAAAFAAKQRKNINPHSRAGPRLIKRGCPVSSKFTPEFICGAKAGMNWTTEDIKDIIAHSKYAVGKSDDNKLITHPSSLLQGKGKAQDKGKTKAKDQNSNPESLSPGQLVKTLVLALNDESLKMAFPYTLMHRWSWNILRKVKGECDPILRGLNMPVGLEQENQLPWVVGFILVEGAGKEGRGQGRRLFEASARAFNRLIDSGAGGLSMKVMKKQGFHVLAEPEDRDGEKE